jgi:hypothetical protein
MIKKYYQCKYCTKKYKRWGVAFFKHFKKKHEGLQPACHDVFIEREA